MLAYLALGTGALEYVHNLQHASEDARIDALAAAAGAPATSHPHDDSNCDIHAQLHMAIFLSHWLPVLVCLGLFVAFVILLDSPLIPRPQPVRIGCRGPPAC